MHALFLGSLEEVARRLVGKVLVVNGHTAIITSVHMQTAENNAKWLKSKPLFGDSPVDAYVSNFRGSRLLFLRTGELNTCVRIDGVQIGGQQMTKPTHVCNALGITSPMSGNVQCDGTVITIIWRS